MIGSRTAALTALVAALVTGAAGLAPSVASAEEQPSILKAYGLDWIERVRDDAWPQPKDQRPVICLLDTGVAVTPDTPADDPNGPIVARLAIDGGSGLPQGSSFEHLHGTTMASVIAAPRNGWGTVGVFPQARIVSIRVTIDDATYITPVSMEAGARLCRRWSDIAGLRIASTVMAESEYDQRPADSSQWETAAAGIAAQGGVFVAAAGNSDEAQNVAPIATRSVLSVSAGADDLSSCSFASRNVLADLRGPGCSTQILAGGWAWPAGSSAATAAVGALAAALACRSPDESVASRVSRLRAAGSADGAGAMVLDGTRLASNFSDFVDAPPITSTTQVTAPQSASSNGPLMVLKDAAKVSTPSLAPRAALWRPKAEFQWSGSRLQLSRVDRRGGVLKFKVRDGAGTRVLIAPNRRASFRVPRQKAVEYWAEAKTGTWRSLTAHAKLPR